MITSENENSIVWAIKWVFTSLENGMLMPSTGLSQDFLSFRLKLTLELRVSPTYFIDYLSNYYYIIFFRFLQQEELIEKLPSSNCLREMKKKIEKLFPLGNLMEVKISDTIFPNRCWGHLSWNKKRKKNYINKTVEQEIWKPCRARRDIYSQWRHWGN